MTDPDRARLAAQAAEHGGELIRADELQVGDFLQLAAGRGKEQFFVWAPITALERKNKRIWLTVQPRPDTAALNWRPAHDDELVAKRG